jgi:hypothetical protein
MFVRWSNLSIEAEEQRRLPGYRDGGIGSAGGPGWRG